MKRILPFLLVLFVACQGKNPSSAETSVEDPGLPAGFAEFYRQFHSDSVFQVEHITFPLQGIPNNADQEALTNTDFRWKKEDWRMMQPIDFQMSEYRRELIPMTDKMVVERILHKSGQYGMMRRFSIIGDEWHLIYYAGMNRLKNEN